MTDNQFKGDNSVTPSEIIVRNKSVLFGVLLVFILLIVCLLDKQQIPEKPTMKVDDYRWFDDEKYKNITLFGNNPHFIPEMLFSRGTLVIGSEKYQEVVTITKIK